MPPRRELQCSTDEYDSSGDGVGGEKIMVPHDYYKSPFTSARGHRCCSRIIIYIASPQRAISHPSSCSKRAPQPRVRKEGASPLTEPAGDATFFLRPRMVTRISPPRKVS